MVLFRMGAKGVSHKHGVVAKRQPGDGSGGSGSSFRLPPFVYLVVVRHRLGDWVRLFNLHGSVSNV